MIPRNCCNFLVFFCFEIDEYIVSAWLSFGYNIATFLPIQNNCTQDKSDNGMQFTVMKICTYIRWCKGRKPNDFESGLIHLRQYFPI